jgi:D-alanyl-D-alanine carboxypeptidase
VQLRRNLTAELQADAAGVDVGAAAAAVMVRGRLVWSDAYGRARTPGAVFSLASLTKPLIAALTLRLVDEGRLSLDDTVGRWLGDAVMTRVRPVTIAQLLGHTSDLSEYLDDPRLRPALRDPRHAWSERELLRVVRRAENPEGFFSYSNSNYIVLGAILRRVSGGTVDALLRQEILSPLDLRRTALARNDDLAGKVAGGGRLGNDVWGELFTDGGAVSSAPDVARFLDALLIQRRLLRPETLRRMQTPGPDGRYGLGLMQIPLETSCRSWGHEGFYAGWDTSGTTETSSGTTIVVLLRGTGPGIASSTTLGLARVLREQGVLRC